MSSGVERRPSYLFPRNPETPYNFHSPSRWPSSRGSEEQKPHTCHNKNYSKTGMCAWCFLLLLMDFNFMFFLEIWSPNVVGNHVFRTSIHHVSFDPFSILDSNPRLGIEGSRAKSRCTHIRFGTRPCLLFLDFKTTQLIETQLVDELCPNWNTKKALTRLFMRLNIYLLIELLESSSEAGDGILRGAQNSLLIRLETVFKNHLRPDRLGQHLAALYRGQRHRQQRQLSWHSRPKNKLRFK